MESTLEISSSVLPVMESFYTLQGEGFHTGKAAYFIRLGGCDVGCVWCDVKDSWDADKHPKFTVSEIVKEAVSQSTVDSGRLTVDSFRIGNGSNYSESINLSTVIRQPSTVNGIICVITGGEPLLHNLDALTAALHEAGFQTNIDTSGSSPLSGNIDWICLSPKKFKPPVPEILPLANELKIVIFNKFDFAWAESFASQVSSTCKLYLQPEWDKKEIVTPLIIDYIKQNPKWQLSLQTHKYIGVP